MKKRAKILAVEIREARPNPLFTEEQRASVRFLRFNQTVECAECGKRRKVMWTMLCEFYAHRMGQRAVIESTKKHRPLSEVCAEHLLAPAWPEDDKQEGEQSE